MFGVASRRFWSSAGWGLNRLTHLRWVLWSRDDKAVSAERSCAGRCPGQLHWSIEGSQLKRPAVLRSNPRLRFKHSASAANLQSLKFGGCEAFWSHLYMFRDSFGSKFTLIWTVILLQPKHAMSETSHRRLPCLKIGSKAWPLACRDSPTIEIKSNSKLSNSWKSFDFACWLECFWMQWLQPLAMCCKVSKTNEWPRYIMSILDLGNAWKCENHWKSIPDMTGNITNPWKMHKYAIQLHMRRTSWTLTHEINWNYEIQWD